MCNHNIVQIDRPMQLPFREKVLLKTHSFQYFLKYSRSSMALTSLGPTWENLFERWVVRATEGYGLLGPVVQSVVSLTSSLRVISLTVLADSIYNILIYFAEKM